MDIKIYTSSELNVRSILWKCITQIQINSYFVKKNVQLLDFTSLTQAPCLIS